MASLVNRVGVIVHFFITLLTVSDVSVHLFMALPVTRVGVAFHYLLLLGLLIPEMRCIFNGSVAHPSHFDADQDPPFRKSGSLDPPFEIVDPDTSTYFSIVFFFSSSLKNNLNHYDLGLVK